MALVLDAALIAFLRNRQERSDLFEKSITTGLNDAGNGPFRVWNTAANAFHVDHTGQPIQLTQAQVTAQFPGGGWSKEHVFERQYLSAAFVRRSGLANPNLYTFPKRALFWLDEVANSAPNVVWVDAAMRTAKTNFFNIRSANFAMTAQVAAFLNACAPEFHASVASAIQQVPMMGPNAPAEFRAFILAMLNDFLHTPWCLGNWLNLVPVGTFWGQ